VGLRNKHLLPLLGQPVIDYTFAHCRQATRLSRVVLSSDCAVLRSRAEANWIETIARPAELSGSDASVQDVMLHAMQTVESRSAFHVDALVVLYGNVPVRPEGAIDQAIELLAKSGCDSVRSFSPVGKWHPNWMARLNGDCVEALHSGSIHRRQDLAPLYLHDGAVVAVSRASMLRGLEMPDDPHAFFGIDRRGFAVGMGETVEIDHQRDLFWAEAVLRERANDAQLTRMAS
jgi:CMP-N-acetylneuraminic acid synthetase